MASPSTRIVYLSLISPARIVFLPQGSGDGDVRAMDANRFEICLSWIYD
ncbi:hypothetical protein MPTK1_8g11480 [Marchantia polymorpha subsp. ruderalis]|uniref:Uncharacterized protein n=1 Tax=Marchantia polymorpha TaxID=3197 RepID=A0A2R6XME8_MARPO|nr:hypothetical protein MARPO_0008s0068 [Marchantia polymorpha]BBN19533.1 hypothetical protein Mp_8g11480 [Marchantia polymorpha subsp. ruderalis]|eukprot:PTQ47291.1 hypothetical protein MARPO_0008s0068 [Marchantia polymorpha]